MSTQDELVEKMCEAARVDVRYYRHAMQAALAVAQQELKSDAQDAARFRFWITNENGVNVNEYLRGVKEGWSLDDWRAFCDTYMPSPPEPPHE